MYVPLQVSLSIFLSVVAFFCNTFSIGGQKTTEVPEGAVRVSYGEQADENFDLYIPDEASGEVDVLLLIHGGAWCMGDTTMFSKESQSACDEGFVTVSVDYTKIQNGSNVPTMVDEIYQAVACIKTELNARGYTTDKMAVVGHSAGANIALLYSYEHYNDSPIEIGFVMANSPPADFFDSDGDGTTTVEKYNTAIVSVLSGTAVTKNHRTSKMNAAIASISPIDHVSANCPPTLIVHGAKDEMVPYTNSVNLNKALKASGVYTQFITYPNSGHFLDSEEDANMKPIRAQAFMDFVDAYL